MKWASWKRLQCIDQSLICSVLSPIKFLNQRWYGVALMADEYFWTKLIRLNNHISDPDEIRFVQKELYFSMKEFLFHTCNCVCSQCPSILRKGVWHIISAQPCPSCYQPGARFTKYLIIYRKIIVTLGYSKKRYVLRYAKDFLLGKS